MCDYRDGLHLIPTHMHAAVTAWLDHAVPPKLLGAFLYAVLTNDLMKAFGYADDENAARMKGWVLFVHNHMPSAAHGSKEKLEAWYRRQVAREAEAAQ